MRPQKDLSLHLYSCLGSPSHAWAQQSSDQAAQSCHLVAAPTNDMAVLTAGGHQPDPPLRLSKTDLQGAGATSWTRPDTVGLGKTKPTGEPTYPSLGTRGAGMGQVQQRFPGGR